MLTHPGQVHYTITVLKFHKDSENNITGRQRKTSYPRQSEEPAVPATPPPQKQKIFNTPCT
uniref:Uncharacterized protein n=1 Tax=Arundo donax TaxID=35708 RepID=A0A0A9DQ04_ARUDO